MPTLATTIGESELAAPPSIVVPEARLTTMRPSRTTVIEAAAFEPANPSKAALARGIPGSGSGATVVVVVVVVEVVVVVVVVVEVVVVVVVVDEVVVVGAAGTTLVADSEPAADWPAQPVANSSNPTITTADCARTLSR
ncbi:MAG TPA: hypothetical protein VMY16_14315 [Ilumatobacteraceae bacterium]|nr:hypothetical protein [Ilumatobacteraceae bacterium]